MNTIVTQEANCKDCHRCVRACPSKAIGIKKGNARVLYDKCILCGRCVVECPQHAKQVESQLPEVLEAIRAGRRVVLSLAPSFASFFDEYNDFIEITRKLRQKGLALVEETAVGAAIVAQQYQKMLLNRNETLISACCPVIVNIIKKYYPQLVPLLANVVSPMIAHAKMLKAAYGEEVFVVFAGPCIAKIEEGRDYKSYIDAVIGFNDLHKWLEDETLTLNCLAEIKCDDNSLPKARYFPVPGGIIKSFMTHAEFAFNTDIVAVDGLEASFEVFDALDKKEISPRFVEALACTGGCVGGPLMSTNCSIASRRNHVINFAAPFMATSEAQLPAIDFSRTHQSAPVCIPVPKENELLEIMQRMGKFTPADEKNCGACGYNTCRDKAAAVYQGIAEIEMCVPYMRSKAESFANIIVDHSLNGIVVVDQKLIIQEFNPTAQRMFDTRLDIIKGCSLASIMDCTEFQRVLKTGEKVVGKRVEYPEHGLVTEQMIIPVMEHGLIIAIIMDVTSEEKRAKEIQNMKAETVDKATEIIKKQMQVAQEIAGLLGETTAETKSALLELIWLLKDKEDS